MSTISADVAARPAAATIPLRGGGNTLKALSIVDQGVFSVGNFALTIMLARHYSNEEFAAYGIGISTALLVQGVQRSTYVIPTSLLMSRRAQKTGPGLVGEHAIVLGLIALCGLMVAIPALVVPGLDHLSNIILSTVSCLLLFCQADYDRVLQIKFGRFFDPLGTSTAYLAFVGLLTLLVRQTAVPFKLILGLLVVFLLCKFMWLIVRTDRPNLRWGWRVLRRDARANTGWSTFGTVAYAGYNHIPLFVLGATSPAIQAAAFVGMRSLMQPVQILVRSLDVVDKHMFRSRSSSDAGGERRLFWKSFALYLAIAVTIALAMAVLAVPLAHLAYGHKFDGFEHLLVGWGVLWGMFTLTLPIESIVFLRGRLAGYNVARFLAGAVSVALAFVLCRPYGAGGALAACLIGWCIAVVGSLMAIRRDVWPLRTSLP